MAPALKRVDNRDRSRAQLNNASTLSGCARQPQGGGVKRAAASAHYQVQLIGWRRRLSVGDSALQPNHLTSTDMPSAVITPPPPP